MNSNNRNEILCGESKQILSTFDAGSIDLVVTDPPYLVRYKDRDGRTIRNDDNAEAVLSVFDEIYRVLKNNSYCISFYGWNEIAAFSGAWKQAGFKTVGHIVWTKPYASRAGHARYCHESAFILAKGYPKKPHNPIDDIQPWEYTGNKSHPTEKAVSVIRPLIESFSQSGDIVLDPFNHHIAFAGSACDKIVMSDDYFKDFDGWHGLKKQIQDEQKVPTVRQREIWWGSIGVNLGVEQDGKNNLYERPVLVIRKFNHRHFMGVPLTSQIKDFPFRHTIYYRNDRKGGVREGQAILSQMRSYDAMRLTRYVAKLGTKQFEALMADIHDMLHYPQ